MRIAVTGGTGYLGAHTVSALLRAGHQVVLLVHPSESVPAVVGMFDATPEALAVSPGDIRDPKTVEALLDGCDAVLHAAGVVGTDNRREQLMWEVNVDATATVLARATALGLDPIVHVASYSALFPSPDPVITPDSPTAPGRSAYGRTKAAAAPIPPGGQGTGGPGGITNPTTLLG
ncbi:NAD-dependent epimerase/dehydratase family protein, partial [Nocardia asiatica]|uniref:NAD-dependent epimerase/dehydratase family protein n=1 Tax=Nocardia asiatica TaxID=209252 RepID=UPI002458D6AD